jgi:hypothetical protein
VVQRLRTHCPDTDLQKQAAFTTESTDEPNSSKQLRKSPRVNPRNFFARVSVAFQNTALLRIAAHPDRVIR